MNEPLIALILLLLAAGCVFFYMVAVRAIQDRAEMLGRALAAEATASERQTALIAAEERVDALTDQLLQMRRDGFNAAPAAPEPVEAEDDLPPRVADALRNIGPEGSEMYRYASRSAERLLAEGHDPEAVAEAVQRGSRAHDHGIGVGL